MLPLPVDSRIPEILALLEGGRSLVVQAAPGTGKTTRIPAALLGSKFRHPEMEIVVLEPRRLAAKMAARRVAEERSEEIGKTIGYQFRFENVGGPQTRLRFMTEGMLMRRLLSDPHLERIAAVVLDEFHERHIHTDVALSYLRQLQQKSRPDLRLIVMSATLDSDAIAKFLGDCPAMRIEGKAYDVETEYLREPPARGIETAVRDAVKRVGESDATGDILVFLPGMAEIRKCADALSGESSRFQVLPLHGDLSREEQDQAVGRGSRRKVILSTNVAETSLTIPGVSIVIDSGLARVASYSHGSGVPRLVTRPISRASAIQRAGRAGRTGPGRCLRLYTRGDFDSRAPFETPEIQRADLSQTVLELASLGVQEPMRFEWFDPPPKNAVDASQALLRRLGAVSMEGSLTDIGRAMVKLPVHPRLARMVIAARPEKCELECATLAAILSEGDLEQGDVWSQVKSARGDRGLSRVRSRLMDRDIKPSEDREAFSRAVLQGFPDRVAKLKDPRGLGEEAEILFSLGGSARVKRAQLSAGSEYFVILDVEEKRAHGAQKSWIQVRSSLPISEEWLLDAQPASLRDETRFELKAGGSVERISTLRYEELVLSSDRRPAQASPEVAGFLADQIRARPELLGEADSLATLRERLKLVSPENAAEILSDKRWNQALVDYCIDKSSLSQVVGTEFISYWLMTLPEGIGAELSRMAPEHVNLASGRRVRVHYEPGQPPWIESRIQDFFGMQKGPTILAGKPLVLKLLAPNQRPVQVTSDLASFWKNAYPEIRKELGRRYPRHKWPEDPTVPLPPK